MSEPQFGPPRQVASSIYEFSPELLEQLAQWLETRGIRTPISQVVGFQQFVGQPAADVLTSESTTSNTYTDLATVGPQLTAVGAGRYLIFFGFTSPGGGAQTGFMSPSLNGSGGSDNTCAQLKASTSSVMRATAATLTSSTNTIVAKYRTDGANPYSFFNRWLFALRCGNV